jgi:DNA-binding NarL/FixJ family response regulator
VTPSIVIVDDHPSFRDMARELLELAGFDVVGEAADGASGIATVLELRPDVVLLDVQLPDRDGIGIADELRGSGSAVVLTSSRRASDFGPRLQRTAARGFIPKDELTGPALQALLTA